ncbi:T9SS type A sorting domain-containing protein [Spirosoma sp. BT702]|uniref:T9SS type A sorting domain-containing protein n=1 Tax=Spirosoma profusum TaxID=2771354 RepID=A0A926XXI0_9BACT|nr:sialate O-acetylesterase [Spirosoma profusum]MBD2699752.1 T9SS type A sorting domain-containing protein [Spirosoma profusum]
MNYFSVAARTAFFLLLPVFAMAQLQVSFPTTRAVFQRDKANQATFRITGYYTTAGITRIEARLIARETMGVTTEWRTIQNAPTGGVFAGDIAGFGGWYNLEVRAMIGEQQTGNVVTVERVGIGEVFIIAGQSNAQGVHQQAPNPKNDLVNCVNYAYPKISYPNEPPTPVFTLLDNTENFAIAPRGIGSWCWGQLGDLLVKRLKVPIMFFNAAYEGTPVRNWRESAPEGGTAFSVYNGDPYPPRQPYINLKLALQFYANMLGLRAVLWHQGEADNLIDTETISYVNDLQTLISISRRDYNQNMSWVVARASYGDDIGKSDANILQAQNLVINNTANVFPGPNTDGIQVPRARPPMGAATEGLHFDNEGLIEVAGAWNASLTDNFFQQSTTIAPAPTPTIGVTCGANNTLTLTVNGNYPNVQWESGETGSSITKGAGTYRAKIKDALGNTFFSGHVKISDAPTAGVVNNGIPSVCVGSSLALTSNYENVTWLDQQQNNATVANTRTFSTTTAGAYYVRYRDISGCDFNSNVVNVRVNPLPATPTVTNEKTATLCQGETTTLRASSDNVTYNWNDGQKAKTISVGANGSYFLTVTDQNGCTSAQSNTVAITVNPIPVKPTVTANGPTTFCADRNVTLTAPQNTAYLWSSGQTTQSLTINQSGDYTVRTRNQFNCSSVPSDIVTVKVNPLPAIPTVSAGGATTFCEGGRVTLTATSSFSVLWSSGQQDKSITVSASGNYAVQSQDQNGCLSPYSTVIAVKANPLPPAPSIIANPSPIICEGDKVTLRVDGPYTVFWNTGDSTKSIIRSAAGTYSARVRDVNGCISAQPGSTTVVLMPLPPAPTVRAIGTYTLEAVSSANGTQFRWFRGADSLALNAPIIKANEPGTYTAKSSIVYSQSLTCFSVASNPLSFTIDVNNKGLSIYPNPNPDKIVFVETQANLTNAILTIYSLAGQPILTTTVGVFDERKQLVLTGWPAGPYILRVQAGSFDVSKRIILGL